MMKYRKTYTAKPDEGYHHMSIDIFGYHRFYNDQNQIHRDGGPAIQNETGEKYWCQNGEFHREDGPAHHHGGISMRWYLFGKELEFPTNINWELLTKEDLKQLLFDLYSKNAFINRTTKSACGCY